MANQNFKVKKGLEVGTGVTISDGNINISGIITAQFKGDGSQLTGVTAAGSGVVVQEEGSNVGTAATINFIGSNVTAALSGGIANVTVSAGSGGISNVVEDTTPQLGGNLDLNSKDITGTGNISITGGFNATGVSTFQENVVFQSTASFGDNDKINVGAGNDLQIYHDSNNSFIKNDTGTLIINTDEFFFKTNDNQKGRFRVDNTKVRFYIDGDEKLRINDDGLQVYDGGTITASSGIVTYIGDGSGLTNLTSDLVNDTTPQLGGNLDGNNREITGIGTISVNTLTVAGLSTFNNTGLFPYSKTLNFGSNTSQEGQLWASSDYFYINSSADNGVFIQADGFIELKRGTSSGKYIEMNSHPNHNGEVSLYYNGNKKLETTNTGITVTGTVGATAFTGDGSQLSGVVSGIELQQAGSSVGTSLTAINFQSGATLTPGSGGISTITIASAISTSVLTPSANTVVTLDLSTAQHHDLTLTAGITTITCSGGVFGESHSVVITQPSSGIATVGFSTFFLFPSGSEPSMSQGNDKIDLLSFVVKRVGTAGTQLLASAGLNYQ